MAGLLPSTKSTLVNCAEEGVWGTVLEILDGLDVGRYRRGYLWDYYGENTTTNITTNDGNDDDHDHHGEHEHSINGKSAIITPLEKTIALTHEMTILELADAGEIELAYASLRLCSEMLNHCLSVNGEQHDTHNHDEDDDLELLNDPTNNAVNERSLGMISSRSGDVERRITALSSLRSSNSTTSAQLMQLLPVNYYGPNNQTRHKRRQFIVKLLKRHVPQVPPQRLSSLLQQSVKWQCFTGVFPTVERLFRDTKEDAANNNNNNNGDDDDDKDNDDGKKKKKRKTKNNNQPEQKFDLVLGNIDILENDKRKKHRSSSKSASGGVNHAIVERMPSRPSQTIRLGKKSYIESALFLPDGKGLVTGSSDGFVEIWGEPLQSGGGDGDGGEGGGGNNTEAGEPSLDNNVQKLLPTNMDYEKLRTSDLPYQRNDDLMMHDSSILAMNVSHDGTLLGTASSDGTVCVWKIMDGKLLRKLERAHGGSDGGKG